MFTPIFLATAVLAAKVAAEYPAASVTVESRNPSTDQLHNTTVTIELNSIYKDTTVLDGHVIALYLTGATGVQKDDISCTPFYNADGAGTHGPYLTSTTVSHITSPDARSQQVASIVCISTGISQPPGRGSSSSATTGHHHTSTTLVTHTPPPSQTTSDGGSSRQSTNAGATAATASASPTASQSAGNAASAIYMSGEFFGGLAIAGFGLAFVL